MELIRARVDVIDAVARAAVDYEHQVRQCMEAASIVDSRQEVEVGPRVDSLERA